MAFDRRSFLKALVAAPSSALLDRNFLRAMNSAQGISETFLLLQGLFFLEFDGPNLIVAAPDHNPQPPHLKHVYYTRLHAKQSLIEMPTDPSYKDILPGGVNCLPPEIPQLSHALIQQPQGFLRNCSKYRCKMILPWPKKIFSLRRSPSGDFCPDTTTKIGGNLRLGPEIATVLALVYDPVQNATPWIESYYAEHPVMPSTSEVNLALVSAKDVCGPHFDLQMCDCISPMGAVDHDKDLPTGLDGTDEYSIEELLGIRTPPVIPPKGPIQPFTCVQPTKKPGVVADCDSRKRSCRHGKVGGDVSSCPLFGISG